MDKLSRKQDKKTKLWQWITATFILLTLISGGFLIYRWWDRRQKAEKTQAKIQELKDQVQQRYQLQEKQLISLSSLENNPKIHSFFTDLLNTYAERFANRQKLDTSHLPLVFGDFYADEKTGKGQGEMGRCSPRIIYPKTPTKITISLNRLYLLNKFGVDKYFASNPEQSGDYSYLDISFSKMLETCSHELSHYIQLVKYGKSSCESDLIKNRGNYNSELAKEQEEWTKEIYGMIKNLPEYSELERKWQKI